MTHKETCDQITLDKKKISEKNIQTKSRPIQISQEVMEFLNSKYIKDLLSKQIKK